MSRVVRFGVFEADLAAGELRREGSLVKLQGQPFRLLVLLLERPGAIITREEVRAALWADGSFVDFEYGVNTAIKKVRYALGDSADNPRFIQTLPRKGYRFIAPVTAEGAMPSPVAVPAVAASPKGRRAWLMVAALAAMLASGLWLLRPRPAPLTFPVPLAPYLGSEWGAAFSPDGNRVAFAWNGENKDNYDIYVKASGSGVPTRLTTDRATDISPAWSRDGRRIAFLRSLGTCHAAVMMVPATGGPEVKIAETDSIDCVNSYFRNLAFSPDGNWILAPDVEANSPGDKHRAGLFLFSVENRSRRPLTLAPPGYAADITPSFSPDGRTLAFIRGPDRAGEVYLLPLDRNGSASGEPRRLTYWNRTTMNPAWTADGREIIVASGEFEHSHLWRVPVSGSPEASMIVPAGDFAILPAIARDSRLAFTRARSNVSIWTLDLSAFPNPGTGWRRWPASSNLNDHSPRFSPDGRRVAFVSTRSGTQQVWIANADGSSPFQLTSVPFSFVGSPNWSHDGSTVVFCAMNNGHWEVYATTAAGGPPRRLIGSSGQDAVASFSWDGRWIYFTSNRTGEFQIWRIPAQGGEAVQLTRRGGRVARESKDGRYLYVATLPRDGRCTLWRMSPAGGEETRILESVWPFGWDLTKSGIYYEDMPGPDGLRTIYFYSFATGRSTQILDARLRGGQVLAISPDGNTLLHDESTEIAADTMVLENFR